MTIREMRKNSEILRMNLPKRSDYVSATTWLKAVRDCIGKPIVFVLDEALMCYGLFCGRSEEYVIWVYGEDFVTHFNGVALLGNHVSTYSVVEKNGLLYTDFNRTIIISEIFST